MSETTARWTLTGLFDGPGLPRRRIRLSHCDSKQAALEQASKYDDCYNVRLLKLTRTRKTKPKSAARMVFTVTAQPTCICCGDTAGHWVTRDRWLSERKGKPILVTLEELEDS